MIKVLTAYTLEIDQPDIAVKELLEQLDIENNLLENSVGIATCYSEFIDSGVIKKLSDALPFSVVGTTTLSTSVKDSAEELSLNIMVITSNEIKFATALSSSLEDNVSEPLEELYKSALSELGENPSFIMTFAPLMHNSSGDMYIDILNKVSGNVLNFGTIAVDHLEDYSTSQVIYKGKGYSDCLGLLLFSGNITPVFDVAFIAENKIQEQSAVITSSDGNILKEINNMSLAHYLETIGLAEDGKIVKGLNTIPFAIDFNDGALPVGRAIFAITPEGYGVCGGIMPEDTTLAIGALGMEDVLFATEKMLDKILAVKNANAVIIFSCIGRNFTLGVDSLAELELIKSRLGNKIPYIACYSGGEICPVSGKSSSAVTRFHNNTIVACII